MMTEWHDTNRGGMTGIVLPRPRYGRPVPFRPSIRPPCERHDTWVCLGHIQTSRSQHKELDTPVDEAQLYDLLYKAHETELGGIQIYEAALACDNRALVLVPGPCASSMACMSAPLFRETDPYREVPVPFDPPGQKELSGMFGRSLGLLRNQQKE